VRGALVRFPAPAPRGPTLRVVCRRAIALYRARSADVCTPWRRLDVVVGRDQHTVARRARLAQLQARVAIVHPFGIDVAGP
jgi:hypothetical protein